MNTSLDLFVKFKLVYFVKFSILFILDLSIGPRFCIWVCHDQNHRGYGEKNITLVHGSRHQFYLYRKKKLENLKNKMVFGTKLSSEVDFA